LIGDHNSVFLPQGQRKGANGAIEFGFTQKLDFEIELGCIIGTPTAYGSTVSTHDAPKHIFGFVMINDWSARDIQSWEYKPLGPFLGKNFATGVGPWVVTTAALQEVRVNVPDRNAELVSYLQEPSSIRYDIKTSVELERGGSKTTVASSNTKDLFWSFEQMIAHHTVNGCALEVGDILASGTISGPKEAEGGCLLELTRNGQKPLSLSNHQPLTFLAEGDEVSLSMLSADGKLNFGTLTQRIQKYDSL
jgi:fumarylacetoacetase